MADQPQGSNVVASGGVLQGAGFAYNLTPGNLAKFRLALSKARDNTADCRILCLGDSTTQGYGSTLATTYGQRASWPARMVSILNTRLGGVGVVNGLAIPANSSAHDSRWAAGTGWGQSLGGFGWGATCNYNGTAPTGSLVFTQDPAYNFDRCYVYYLTTGGSGGTLTFNSTGASPSTQATTAAAGVARVAVSITSGNTFSIIGTADSKNIYVVGVEPYLNATKQVLVGTAVVYGAQTSGWNNSSNWMSLQCIGAHAPDLTIISLGINDANNTVAVATYLTNIQAIITKCQLSGDVLLLSMPPSTGANYVAYEALYVPALRQLSNQLSVPMLDLYNRWGAAQPTGFFADTLHPNNNGYMDIAQFVASAITNL